MDVVHGQKAPALRRHSGQANCRTPNAGSALAGCGDGPRRRSPPREEPRAGLKPGTYTEAAQARVPVLLSEAVVLFEDGAELVVGNGHDAVIFDAGHGLGGDHRVDDGFFDGLDGS